MMTKPVEDPRLPSPLVLSATAPSTHEQSSHCLRESQDLTVLIPLWEVCIPAKMAAGCALRPRHGGVRSPAFRHRRLLLEVRAGIARMTGERRLLLHR